MGFGLKGHTNEVYNFNDLINMYYNKNKGLKRNTEDGQPDDVSDQWLGLPVSFKIPVLMLSKVDDESQTFINVHRLPFVVVRDKQEYLIFNPGASHPYAVTYNEAKQELTLSVVSVVQNKKGKATLSLKSQQPILTLYDTSDVESLLSCYLTLLDMASVNIITMDRVITSS